MKIKKGDSVKVISGKDKGKKSKVLQILPAGRQVVVEDTNVFIKHLRPKRSREKGQKIRFNAPLNVSKVMLICPKCSRPTRVGYKILDNKKKMRLCRKCKELID